MAYFSFDYAKIKSNTATMLKQELELNKILMSLGSLDIRLSFDGSEYANVKKALDRIGDNLNQSKKEFNSLRNNLNDIAKIYHDVERDISGKKVTLQNIRNAIERNLNELGENVEQTFQNVKEEITNKAVEIEDALSKTVDDIKNNIADYAKRLEIPEPTLLQLTEIFEEKGIPAGTILVLDYYLKSLGWNAVAACIGENFPSIEEHFSRNENMPISKLPQSPEEADELGWNNGVASNCHQFTSDSRDNEKWVSPDGTREVIFNSKGEIVSAPEDCGTYNYADPQKDPLLHFVKDVLPWIVFGNSLDDSTGFAERMFGFVGLYI